MARSRFKRKGTSRCALNQKACRHEPGSTAARQSATEGRRAIPWLLANLTVQMVDNSGSERLYNSLAVMMRGLPQSDRVIDGSLFLKGSGAGAGTAGWAYTTCKMWTVS